MTKTLYQVYVLIDGEWLAIPQRFTSRLAACKAVEECDYAPDEYKIIKIEKEI